MLGNALLWGRKHDQALAQFEEGLKANPNDADLLAYSAEVYVWMGQPEEAIQRIKQAMRLNPYYPNWYLFIIGLGPISCARDYEGAVETLRQMSPIGVARRILAASLAYLGRMEEARAEAEKFLKDEPLLLRLRLGQPRAVSPRKGSTARRGGLSSRPAFRGENFRAN